MDSISSSETFNRCVDILSVKLEDSSRNCILASSLYVPIYDHFKQLIELSTASPLVVGISGPQGCGKSTLVEVLQNLFCLDGLTCVAMSLDDFYLTYSDQECLSDKYPDNSLLRFRGNAGTHDLNLISQTLQLLSSHQSVSIPRYDKSLRCGRGDRVSKDEWTVVSSLDVRVVLIEGWMLGFNDIKEAAALCSALQVRCYDLCEADKRALIDINNFMKDYSFLNTTINHWLVLAVEDVGHVYRWRLEAEHAMADSGKIGLSDEQIRDFIDRFMPAYKLYLPDLYSVGPVVGSNIQTSALDSFSEAAPVAAVTPFGPLSSASSTTDSKTVLKVDLDEARRPVKWTLMTPAAVTH